jgi:WD40 repeat protein
MLCTPLLTAALFGAVSDPAAAGFGKETVLWKDLPAPVTSVTVSADGRFLFVLDRGYRLRIRDRASGELRSLGITGPKWLAVSRDAKYIFSGGAVRRNEFRDNRGFLGFPEQVMTRGQALWSTNVRKKDRFPDTIAFPEGHRFPVTAAAFSADGKLLVTATGKDGRPGEVKVWAVPSGKEKLPRIEYKASAFYSRSGDDDVFGLPASLREAPGVELLALSADGSVLATAYKGTRAGEFGRGAVRLWDVARGKAKGRIVIAKQSVYSLAFTPEGKLLAVGVGKKDEGSVRLWDVSASKSAGTLRGHPRPVQALATSPDGRHLASGCAGGVVKVWDLAGKREIGSRSVSRVAEPVLSLTYTPDGKALVIGGGKRRGWVRLWAAD